MKAQVKLYNVGFNSNMNCVVDDIAAYLRGTATTVITYDDVMYQKIELDMELKLPLTQSLNERPSFNYISILNDDGQRPFYFFVRDVQWLSQQGLRILLSMDTLNTFQDLLVFSNNTKITRQHKDRFYREYYDPQAPILVTRKIDLPSEVTGLTKYRGVTSSIRDGSNNTKWYLVYANENDSDNSPIACYLVPETTQDFVGSGSSYSYSTFITGNSFDMYLIKEVSRTLTLTLDDDTTVTVKCNSSQTWYIRTPGGAQDHVEVGRGHYAPEYTNVKSIAFNGTTHLTLYHPGFAPTNFSEAQFLQIAHNSVGSMTLNSGGDFTLNGIANIHRTSTKLLKIIQCPYCPLNLTASGHRYFIPNGTSVVFLKLTEDPDDYGGTFLKLDDISKDFIANLWSYSLNDFTCSLPSVVNRRLTAKNALYESKLYHSDFHNLIFNYDSFTKNVPLENIKPSLNASPYLKIQYKQANTITSNLGFKFEITQGTQKLNDRFEEYLLCRRNNEYPIFNSSYLNYIRNGYNYDVKAKNLQVFQGTLGTALSIGGGIVSLLASGATGGVSAALGVSLITSAITSMTSTIASSIQSDANIEQKLNEAKNTTNSVNSSDDLNLLNWYSDNNLWATTYDISNEQKSNVFELFYKTGYACNETGTPDVHSRYRFNFLQCTPDFTTKANPIWQEYIQDVVARFELGVTYFHTYSDFDQQYENWESWLMP